MDGTEKGVQSTRKDRGELAPRGGCPARVRQWAGIKKSWCPSIDGRGATGCHLGEDRGRILQESAKSGVGNHEFSGDDKKGIAVLKESERCGLKKPADGVSGGRGGLLSNGIDSVRRGKGRGRPSTGYRTGAIWKNKQEKLVAREKTGKGA